jgi:murein DD-endopeptidase MepM/ murein hydrolase activator NlpD
MAVGDLVAQIMASEGAGQPAAGVGGLANLFAIPRQISPSSPAPMEPGMLQAPKPTAEMFPGANASKAPNPLSWMDVQPSSGYGVKRATGTHPGIDYPVPNRTPIGTLGPGVVVTAKKDDINGNHVIVRHLNGQSTSYSHLSALNVKPGQTVEKGDVLGASGNTGRVRGKNGGYHLHLGARDEKNNRINPSGVLSNLSALGVARKGTAPEREPAVAAGIDSAAAPVAVPTGETMDAPKGRASRFRPMFEQKQSEFQQRQAELAAATPKDGKPPQNLVYNLEILSDELRQLKGLVTAEEGAVVDAERAAVLERKASRLGREEELIERTRRLAPGNALIAFGNALAGAKPGEKFASALARGLQAGSESYTGARDTREASLRGIEEKRDAFDIQRMDALDAARERAIALQAGGDDRTKGLIALKAARGEGQLAEFTNPLRASVAESEASTAKSTASKTETEAEKAGASIDAEIAQKLAMALYYQAGGGRSDGTGNMTQNQLLTKIGDLSKERRGLMIKLNSPTTVGNEKAAVKLAIKYIDDELAGLRGGRPAAPAAPAGGNPPVAGARWSPTQQGWFIPDPKRPGKYLEVVK